MREISCDVAIIGAGTAGLAARTAAAGTGARTVLIEAGPGGTTCARVGCMPSKLLIAAADAAEGARRIGAFGLALDGTVRVDGRAVMERLRRERDRFVGSVFETVAKIPEAEKIAGRARFRGPTTLAIGDDFRVEARAIVIATGSKSTVPPELERVRDLVLTNETVFELPDLPASLAVIGAGPLGLELAQAFGRLGVRVAVFDKGVTIGGLKDADVVRSARDVIGRELDLRLETTFEAERAGDGGVHLAWRAEDGRTGTDTFERVLVAAGRPPVLDGLDLDKAGLELDDHGTPVFDPATLRCGDSAVFIAGDANADRPVLHEASFEGAIAGRNAARFPDVQPSRRVVPLAITYSDPEIAIVGPGWATIDETEVAVASVDLGESGRARVLARNAGLIRVYARREDGVLLGAEMVGPQVEHLAHLIAWAVQGEMTVSDMLALPFYHPTVEESLRSAIRHLCSAVNSRPKTKAGDLEFGPGV